MVIDINLLKHYWCDNTPDAWNMFRDPRYLVHQSNAIYRIVQVNKNLFIPSLDIPKILNIPTKVKRSFFSRPPFGKSCFQLVKKNSNISYDLTTANFSLFTEEKEISVLIPLKRFFISMHFTFNIDDKENRFHFHFSWCLVGHSHVI